MKYYSLTPGHSIQRLFCALWVAYAGLRFISRDNLVVNFFEILVLGYLLFLYHEYRISVREKQRTLNSLTSDDVVAIPQNFALYLRPFRTAKKIPVRSVLKKWSLRMICGARWDVETAISFSLQQKMPLVAIGEKRNSLGAIKIFTPEDAWKQKFHILCESAGLIFVLPLMSRSTTWEIQQIVENSPWRSKCFFIMPPTISILQRVCGLLGLSPKSQWVSASEFLKSVNVHLPAYRPEGGLFRMKSPHQWEDNLISLSVLSPDEASLLLVGNEHQKYAIPSLGSMAERKIWFDRFPWKWTIAAPNFSYAICVYLMLISAIHIYFVPYNVPSGAMIPTIMVGDYIFANRSPYGWNLAADLPWNSSLSQGLIFAGLPRRGEVAVFKLPRDPSQDYIERIVGLPGDRIAVRGGILQINGEPVRRESLGPYTVEGDGPRMTVRLFREVLPNGVSHKILEMSDDMRLDNTQEYVVPPGHLFGMGDNRDNSQDSRELNAVGFIPVENLVGRVDLIYLSVDGSASWWEVWRWPFAIRWSRLFMRVQQGRQGWQRRGLVAGRTAKEPRKPIDDRLWHRRHSLFEYDNGLYHTSSRGS